MGFGRPTLSISTSDPDSQKQGSRPANQNVRRKCACGFLDAAKADVELSHSGDDAWSSARIEKVGLGRVSAVQLDQEIAALRPSLGVRKCWRRCRPAYARVSCGVHCDPFDEVRAGAAEIGRPRLWSNDRQREPAVCGKSEDVVEPVRKRLPDAPVATAWITVAPYSKILIYCRFSPLSFHN